MCTSYYFNKIPKCRHPEWEVDAKFNFWPWNFLSFATRIKPNPKVSSLAHANYRIYRKLVRHDRLLLECVSVWLLEGPAYMRVGLTVVVINAFLRHNYAVKNMRTIRRIANDASYHGSHFFWWIEKYRRGKRILRIVRAFYVLLILFLEKECAVHSVLRGWTFIQLYVLCMIMCVWACVSVSVCVLLCVYVSVCVCVCVFVCVYVSICVSLSVCVCLCICVHDSVCVFLWWVSVGVCMCVCLFVCVCLCYCVWMMFTYCRHFANVQNFCSICKFRFIFEWEWRSFKSFLAQRVGKWLPSKKYKLYN